VIGRSSRRVAALLVVLAAVVAVVIGGAGPVSAHATLVATDPAEGAVLAEAPERVTFTFNEAVIGVPTGVRVYDARGGEVDSSASVGGSQLLVDLDEEVGDGTLVVVWRLVSEDGHPIGGSLTFSVGAPSATVEKPPVGEVDPDAPWTLSLARWAGYVGLLVGAGLVWFAVVLLPASDLARSGRRRVVGAARAAATCTGFAWLLALPLTAMYQLGGGADTLVKGSTWSALPWVQYVVTALVVLGVVGAVVLLGDGLPGRSRRTAAAVAGAVAVVAPALTGHTRAASPEVLVVGADMLHLLAGAVWFGGLIGLALTLPGLADKGELGGEVLARFSGLGAGVLVALVATGSLLAWRIVGSWGALVDTGYGQLLLVKVAIALVVVGIAAWNRFRLLPLLRRADRRRDRRTAVQRVVRATVAEAAVLVVVLLVTGVLVDKSPGPDRSVAAAVAGPAVSTGTLGDVAVRATMSPAATGPSTVTIAMADSAGEPFEGFEAPRARLSSDEVDLGDVPVQSVAPGTYSAQVVLPSAGTWRLQVSLRTTEFDNPVTTLEFTVEGS
jgi:copper transport protein